jgi:hypothetical protein
MRGTCTTDDLKGDDEGAQLMQSKRKSRIKGRRLISKDSSSKKLSLDIPNAEDLKKMNDGLIYNDIL